MPQVTHFPRECSRYTWVVASPTRSISTLEHVLYNNSYSTYPTCASEVTVGRAKGKKRRRSHTYLRFIGKISVWARKVVVPNTVPTCTFRRHPSVH